jgi:hypothetical protein
VYGPNAVAHVIQGKAVSRALHGHFLVEAALVNKIMLVVLPCHEEQGDHSLVGCTEENENDHKNGTSGKNKIPEICTVKHFSTVVLVRFRKSMESKIILYQFLILLIPRN